MELEITTLIADGKHREALTLMARTFQKPLGRFCSGFIGSRSDAEELVQEAFMEAYRAMSRFRAEGSVRAWLFGIARRVCIRHLRRRDRRLGLLRRFFVSEEPAGEAKDPAEKAEAQAMVRTALAKLRPLLREALLLRYQQDMDHQELAAVLGIRPEAARKRVSLAVMAMREALHPILMQPPEEKTRGENQNGDSSVSTHPRPHLVGS